MPTIIVKKDPKQLRRDVRGAVLGVAAFIMTMNVVAVIVVMVALLVEHPELFDVNAYLSLSASPFSSAFDDASNLVLEMSEKYAGLASILGMLCGLPWFFLLRGKSFLTKDVSRVNSKVRIGTIAFLFVLILGVQAFMSLSQIAFEPLFNQSDISVTEGLDESMTALATSFWGILYIVIIGPICEELVFRGAVMRKLEPYGANFAIVVSSLLFGLYHLILFQAVFAFLVGIVLAYTAGRFSLKWAMLLHMLNNGVAVLSIVGGSDVATVMTLCFMGALVVAIVVLIVKRRLVLAQATAGAPSEPAVFARAFCSPWLIIYIVLCGLSGIGLLGVF